MGLDNLFDGIAIVIDDEIGNEGANINNLIKQIEKRNMPCLKFTEIPDEDDIRHFGRISFLLFDWKYDHRGLSSATEQGVRLPDSVRQSSIQKNISFLKEMQQICFAPVFIFTNESPDVVTDILRENDLYRDEKSNYIFVKRKVDLTGTKKLFIELEKWISRTPSIYVLKAWEKEYQRAHTQLFHEFFAMSPDWPKILWNSFEEDGINKSQGLGEVITRNLSTRISPFSFDKDVLGKRVRRRVAKNEVRIVLEGERYIKSDDLYPDDIGTGDVFYGRKTDDGDDRYWLNIRAQCDLDRSSKPELYCLKGNQLDETTINKKDGVRFIEGQFIEKVNNAIVGFIAGGEVVEFKFRDLHVIKWNKFKDKRIGRLLPPHITRIQQRYALCMHRQALPRIPESAIR